MPEHSSTHRNYTFGFFNIPWKFKRLSLFFSSFNFLTPPKSFSKTGFISIIFLIAIAFLQTACSSSALSFLSNSEKAEKPAWESMTLFASDEANSNSALSVDLVMVLNQSLLPIIADTPANKWFTLKNNLINTYPTDLRVLHYEIVPRQSLNINTNDFNKVRIWAAYVYADYKIPGDFKKRLAINSQGYVIQLNKTDFAIKDINTKLNR
jgi:type VI secretion system protein